MSNKFKEDPDEWGKSTFADVGFEFNLYDNFISGMDRILVVDVPKDKDYNNLKLCFDWECKRATGLYGDYEVAVQVNDQVVAECVNQEKEVESGTVEFKIPDATLNPHSI